MTATPIWFGPHDRRLFGFFHAPVDRKARAGVVVCPPLGRDYMHAHYALRLLAERLAELGLCVLRFDYDGTGDSAGDDRDPDRVVRWLASVRAAAQVVRSAGPSSLTVVGMRLGATLAGAVAEQDGNLDGLVLWDPVVSGRAYLSEQRALQALSLAGSGPRADGSVETPGMVFEAATVQELRSLDLGRTVGPLARRVLVLTRPDRERGRLADRLDLPHVEWLEATGQAELMDVGSPNQVMPYGDIERIAGWVGRQSPVTPSPVTVPLQAGDAVVARAVDGTRVIETPTRLGPAQLFGFLTEVPGSSSGPTVLFLNVANEHRIGPGRMWVNLARQLAASGVRSFRLDLSGLGDSATRDAQQRRFVTRAPEAFDDVVDTCRALCPEDPSNVILIGLCASAYQALDSAFEVRPRGVIAINPVISFFAPELLTEGSLDPRRHVAIPRKSAIQAFHGTGDGLVPRFRRRFPRLNARVRDLTEVIDGLTAPPRRRPARWLRELTSEGVDVLLICGEREARPIQLSGLARTFRRIERTGRYQLDVIAGLEHGLLLADHRVDVAVRTIRHVSRFLPGNVDDGSPLPFRPEERVV